MEAIQERSTRQKEDRFQTKNPLISAPGIRRLTGLQTSWIFSQGIFALTNRELERRKAVKERESRLQS